MDSIFRLKPYTLYLGFYKKYFLTFLLITLFLNFIGCSLPIIILFKFLFFGLLHLIYFEVNLSKKLTLYQNFGISRTRLFIFSFLIDSLITFIVINILSLILGTE